MPTLNSYKINIGIWRFSTFSLSDARPNIHETHTQKESVMKRKDDIQRQFWQRVHTWQADKWISIVTSHRRAPEKRKLSPTFINTVYTRRRKWRNLHGRHLDRYLAAIAGSRSSHDDRGRLSWEERKRGRKRRNRERCLVPWLRFLIMKMSGRFFSGERMKVPKE